MGCGVGEWIVLSEQRTDLGVHLPDFGRYARLEAPLAPGLLRPMHALLLLLPDLLVGGLGGGPR